LNYAVSFCLREVRDVYDLQVKWFWRSDYLNGLAVSDVERRPQNLVAPSDLVERSFQRACIEFSLQQDSAHKVVSGITRFELIEKPESLLRERQRSETTLFATRNSFSTGGVDSLFAQQRVQQRSPFSRELERSFC
jgi:hypothetical protein